MKFVLVLYTYGLTLESQSVSQKFYDLPLATVSLYTRAEALNLPTKEVDADLIKTNNNNQESFPSVLHALIEGWELIGPPISHNEGEYATWWLKKDCK